MPPFVAPVFDTGLPGTPPNPDPGSKDNSNSSGSGPIPGIDVYGPAATLANNAYAKALLQLNQNRLGTLTNYGYRGDINPDTGIVGNIRVDPSAMYGQLQQMLHNQAIEDRNAEFGVQDRGLTGGLAHQASSELHYAHGAQDTRLGTSLLGQLSDFQTQQQSADEARNNALWQAEQAQLGSDLQAKQNATITDLIHQLLGGGGSNDGSGDGSGGGGDGSKSPKAAVVTPNSPSSAAALYRLLNPLTAKKTAKSGGSGGRVTHA